MSCLPRYAPDDCGHYLCYLSRRHLPARIRVFIDYMAEQTDVVDADLADYFGSIPRAELMVSLARRVVDRRVLRLIKMGLECPLEETDNRDRKTRTTEARESRHGIPQGSPVSPLLATIYMSRFVLAWKKLGLQRSPGSRIVTCADDLVILCKRGKAEEALLKLREIMGKLCPTGLDARL